MDNETQPQDPATKDPKLEPNQTPSSSLNLSDNHSSFHTPEEIAKQDEKTGLDGQKTKPLEKLKLNKHWWKSLTKKQKIILGCAAVIIVGVLITVIALTHHKPKPIAVTKKPVLISKPVSTTVPSTLTGLQVSPSVNKLAITGVMIENSDGARPQSGLSQAGVVFEALAEGGITRFLALYQNNQSVSIGPVRSARPYFIDWLLPFNAAYAHVGGSPAALSEIQSLNVRDMNEFYNGSSYTRITSREAPHNVYTTLATLTTLEQSKGWATSSFIGFPRKADSPSKSVTAAAINLNISYADMNVNYVYNPKNNSYSRSEGGAPMVDADTNQQIDPKVVIAMVVPWSDGPIDASGAYYTDYSDIGSGAVDVFQDGTVTQGTWDKSSPGSQIQFNTASGTPIKLNAGQTWITALGSASEIQYQP